MTSTDRLAARRSRVAASWVVATAATVIAGAAHALGGGGTPSATALVTALVVSTLVGIVVIGPRPSSPRILVGVALDQAIFHSLFSFFAAAASATASAGHAAHAGHLPAPAALAPSTMPEANAGAMTLTHAAAGAVAFLLVRFGIDAVARAVRTLALRVALLLEDAPTPAPVAATPRTVVTAPALPPLAGILQRLELRRGPPRLAAV